MFRPGYALALHDTRSLSGRRVQSISHRDGRAVTILWRGCGDAFHFFPDVVPLNCAFPAVLADGQVYGVLTWVGLLVRILLDSLPIGDLVGSSIGLEELGCSSWC